MRADIGGLVLAAALVSTKAYAARDISPVIASACSGSAVGESLRMRLAEAALAQAGVLGSDLLADPGLASEPGFGARAMTAMHRGTVGNFADPAMDIRSLRQRLEQYLGPHSNVAAGDRKLEAVDPPADSNWLFDRDRPIVLRCLNPKPPKPVIAQFEVPAPRNILSIREKVDELGLVGDGAKKAGAAKVGLKRTRTEKKDGTTKSVTSLAVNGTVGLRLTGVASPTPLYFYGSYALSHERTKPADPSKKQSDGDVEALESGLSINSLLIRSESDFSLIGSGQIAYVDDFANNARRLKLRGSLTPGFAASLAPLCDLGGYTDVTALNLRFRTRCLVSAEVEASHVFEAGTADFRDHGEFLGLGARFTYQIAAPLGDKSAVLGSISYRYLPTIVGEAPDISRWDASVKYRFWLDNGPGLDFGLTLAKGNEPISYAREDKLELGFGVIF